MGTACGGSAAAVDCAPGVGSTRGGGCGRSVGTESVRVEDNGLAPPDRRRFEVFLVAEINAPRLRRIKCVDFIPVEARLDAALRTVFDAELRLYHVDIEIGIVRRNWHVGLEALAPPVKTAGRREAPGSSRPCQRARIPHRYRPATSSAPMTSRIQRSSFIDSRASLRDSHCRHAHGFVDIDGDQA